MQSLSIGPVSVSLYSVSVTVALAAGLGLLWHLARRRGLDAGLALDAALVAIVLGLIAARVETIITNPDYFSERPSLVVSVSQGGVGVRALTLVGMVTYFAMIRRRTQDWRPYLSVLTPAAALGASLMWAGSLTWGGFAGVPWSGPGAMSLPDRYGVVVPRLPLQVAMSLAHAAFLVATLTVLPRALPSGLCLSLWGASTSALAAFLANFRAEQPLLAGILPRSLVADLALAAAWLVVGLLLLAPRSRRAGGPDRNDGRAERITSQG